MFAFFPVGVIGPRKLDAVVALLILAALAVTMCLLFWFRKFGWSL
jgi:hypothetical protein